MGRRGKRSKGSSGKGKVLVVLLLLVIIAAGGMLAYKYYMGKEPNNIEEGQEEPIVAVVKKLQIVDEKSKSRPFAVMINNISVARPLQSGLQDAYIIYEMIVEGGITRYMALFLDQDTERIGSSYICIKQNSCET